MAKKVSRQTTAENSQGRADVTWPGSSFQTQAVVATGKARSLTVDNHLRWMISDVDNAEQRRSRASRSVVRSNPIEH